MKVRTIITTYSAVIASALLAVSCVKQTGKEVAVEQTDFTNKVFVQVYNGALNTTRNYVYVDGNAVTGASMPYAAIFPATSTPADFSINAGVRAFLIRDTLGTSTQPPMSFAENFEANKNYTIFMYDTSTTVKQKTVMNNITIPSDTTARIRFANLIYNPGALASGFDIFSVKRNAVIFSNVRETEVTDYIPYASASTDTFYIRLNGVGTNLQNVDTLGKTVMLNVQAVLNPTRKRSYTIVFRGGYRSYFNKITTGAAWAHARTLATFANY